MLAAKNSSRKTIHVVKMSRRSIKRSRKIVPTESCPVIRAHLKKSSHHFADQSLDSYVRFSQGSQVLKNGTLPIAHVHETVSPLDNEKVINY